MNRKYWIFIPTLTLSLAACANNKVEQPMPDLTFSKMTAEPVYVGSYEVVPAPAYAQGALPQGFITDPSKNIYDYLSRRYQATGVQGVFRIAITNVSVNHSVLQSENKVGAFFNVAKKDKYDLAVVLRLELQNVGQYERQNVDLKASRSISISEHVSLAERERLQIETVNEIIGDLDREMQKIVAQQFNIGGKVL